MINPSECTMPRVTVSGSFRRHMNAINEAVTELVERGIEVLSPADPRIVAQIGEFVFVASDRVRSIKMVQDRHLECIRASDFLWLVAPDGYVGQSASMELGFAVAHNVPVFCQTRLVDGTLDKYVNIVQGISAALTLARRSSRSVPDTTFLVHPLSTIDQAQDRLDHLRSRLTAVGHEIHDHEGEAMLVERKSLARLISASVPDHSGDLQSKSDSVGSTGHSC